MTGQVPIVDWRPTAPWFSCTAPLTSGSACRSPSLTRRVVAQFEVATHPRWRPRDLSGTGRVDTLCNVFFSDVTRALGCEANHLEMGRDGKPYELDANNLVRWLAYSGPRHGWRSTLSPVEAGNAADLGLVVGVTWLNPEGIGHVGLVEPSLGATELLITQAGVRCFEREPLAVGFGHRPVVFYVHN